MVFETARCGFQTPEPPCQMTTGRRSHFEALLLEERSRIHSLFRRMAATGAGLAPTESPPPGEESEAGAAGASPRDDDAVAVQQAAELAEIDAALRRLRASPDEYGRCIVCSDPIPAARLELLPATSFCETHAR
jgi:RNA polymerase-binding transcription factor DksA